MHLDKPAAGRKVWPAIKSEIANIMDSMGLSSFKMWFRTWARMTAKCRRRPLVHADLKLAQYVNLSITHYEEDSKRVNKVCSVTHRKTDNIWEMLVGQCGNMCQHSRREELSDGTQKWGNCWLLVWSSPWSDHGTCFARKIILHPQQSQQRINKPAGRKVWLAIKCGLRRWTQCNIRVSGCDFVLEPNAGDGSK